MYRNNILLKLFNGCVKTSQPGAIITPTHFMYERT